jgi:DUF971 family protein
MSAAWPVRLVFRRQARALHVAFDDGLAGDIPYTALRRASPSAEVRGHGSGPPPVQPPVPEDIDVTGAEPVGRYAVRIRFSDGHATGLYTWDILRGLAEDG